MGFGIIKPSSGGGTEKAPAGNHLAVLIGLFDMGHQWQEPFAAGDKGHWARRAFFVWELVGEKVTGADKNHVIGIDLTLSLHEKSKFRAFVEGRTGKKLPDNAELDPTTELGQACFLNVVEKNGYPKVQGCAAVPKGIPVPKPGYTPIAIGLEEFRAGATIPDWCPWLYGSALAAHINACREIGGEKPTAKKKADQPTDGEPQAPKGGPIPF